MKPGEIVVRSGESVETLRFAEFRKVKLTGLFSCVDFSYTKFIECDIDGAMFYNCDFRCVKFVDTVISDIEFKQCYFEYAEFSGCKLDEIRIHNCDFGALVSDTTVNNLVAYTSSFKTSVFTNVLFDDIDMSVSSLDGSLFVKCTINKVKLWMVDIRLVRFTDEQQG